MAPLRASRSRARLFSLLCSTTVLVLLYLYGQLHLLQSYLNLLTDFDPTLLASISFDNPARQDAAGVNTAEKTLRTSTQRNNDNSKHSPNDLQKVWLLDTRNVTNKNEGKMTHSVSIKKTYDGANTFGVKPKTEKKYQTSVTQSTSTQKQDLARKRLPDGSRAGKAEMTAARIIPLRFDQVKNKGISTATPEGYFLKKNPSETNTDKSAVVVSNGVNTEAPFRKWAYAFLIGGCSEYNTQYRGFLYNAVVAAQRLREFGSKADVVVFIQMSVSSDDIALPQEEERMVRDMDIKIYYLPKFRSAINEVFYALMMEKFRILELTEYSRVLFVDADIMPLCSLDYIFELSEPESGEPRLKENVVLSWKGEPANGGFFMLKPSIQDYVKLLDIIHRRELKALNSPWPHWDEVEGWGHKIEAPDFWRSPNGIGGTNWTWHGVFADQGLLYHWTKYDKQSVSLIIDGEVENWGSKNGTAFLEETLKRGFLDDYDCSYDERRRRSNIHAPYRDYVHFTGDKKPWEKNRTALYAVVPMSTSDLTTDFEFFFERWYITLRNVAELINFTFDLSFAQTKEEGGPRPPVGRAPCYRTMIKHISDKANNNWTHYEYV